MLRRPPTVIALTENDLQFHLQRIFARSLPPNIDQLSLEDTDQNYAHQDPSSEDQQPSTDKPADRLDPHRPLHGSTRGSSCMTRPSSTVAQAHSAALPASMMNGSTHRTIVDPNGAGTTATTTAQLISSHLPRTRASRLRESSPSHPTRTELTIPPQEFLNRHILLSPNGKKENHRRRHPQDAWATPSKDESPQSRLSTSQTSRLSPSAFPDLTINIVPQRDLTLAPTESYEAGLADTKASPAAADTN